MEDFPSNSQKNRVDPKKDDPKKIKKVVEGTVVRRKKSLGKKFKELFFGVNAKDNWHNVLYGVMIPAAKDMIFDAGKEILERRVFGESRYGGSRRGGRNYSSGTNSHIQYNKMSYSQSTPRDRDEPRNLSRRARSKHQFDEIIISTRREAEDVISQLFDLIETYDVVSVYDLYEITNITGDYTDKKWGWTDIQDATVTHVRDGYLLDLPRPQPID